MRSVALAVMGACSFEPGFAHPDAPPPILPDAPAPAPCLDTTWCLRKTITVDRTQIVGSPADFMLLVRIPSDPQLAAGAQPTGNDIRFVAADGSSLAYQRERYDAGTGALLAWVQVAAIETVDHLYMYYGNPTAADQQAGAAAWPARYAAVWHLDEPSGDFADVTNANTAVPTNGPMPTSAAVIGGGVTLDGTDDFLRVTKSASLDSTTGNATFALWINWDSLTSVHYQRVLASDNRFASTNDGYEWAAQPAGDFFLYPWGGAQSYNLGPNPFTAGTWQYLVATLDFANREVLIFVNGVPMTFTTENDSTAWTTAGMPGNWLWGCNITLTGCFAGKLDEIQVIRGTRNAPWISTSFANQRPDSTLLTIGPEQRLPPP